MSPASQPKNFKVRMWITVGVIVGVITFMTVQQLFFRVPSLGEAMAQAATNVNMLCPMMVDNDTRLDSAKVLRKDVFEYYYTLVHVEKNGIDIGSLQSYATPMLVNNVKADRSFKIFRKNRITIQYSYRDKNGVPLFDVKVTPDMYNNF